jgi:filamentous hemagglutinin
MVPGGIPDTFKPSTTIPGGSKFKYEVNGTKVEIKWHAPDGVAAQKFPGSRSGAMWTAQIKIGKKLLGSDGRLYSKPSDLTHIPIDF